MHHALRNMPLEDDIPELSQEHRDLLMLLRAAINGTVPTAPPSDWVKVLEIARFHQVDMFLYPAVAGWPASFQPSEDLMSGWRTAYFTATFNYERASAQLKEILSALHQAAVPVIPLKGAWLAEKIYDEGAMRPMCDFDLLVPLEQLDRARAVFEKLGYTTSDHYVNVDVDKHLHYHHADHPLMIELHFRVWEVRARNISEPNLNGMWSGLTEETLHGIPLLAFPPERQLIYLTRHILQHSLIISLKAYLDLILMIRSFPLDPEKLEEDAKIMAIPFGARFVLQVAMDIAGEEAEGNIAEFLNKVGRSVPTPPRTGGTPVPTPDNYKKERETALRSALNLSSINAVIRPGMEDFLDLPIHKRMIAGVRLVFTTPAHIRSRYPEAVRRFGLPGGYVARIFFLLRYSAPVRNKRTTEDPTIGTEFENFNSRENLCEWIHEKDRDEAPRSEVRGQRSAI